MKKPSSITVLLALSLSGMAVPCFAQKTGTPQLSVPDTGSLNKNNNPLTDTVKNNLRDSLFLIAEKARIADSINAAILAFRHDTSYNHIATRLKIAYRELNIMGARAKLFVDSAGLDKNIVFLVDMSLPSGKNRFFVYNLAQDSIEYTSMVSHGWGSHKPGNYDSLFFSNSPNSFSTSLGRYKVGEYYVGSYGKSYRLYGLDSSNSNAFNRRIVIHGSSYIPEKEPFPYHIFESEGCPALSPKALAVISRYISVTAKPILLWIYYGQSAKL